MKKDEWYFPIQENLLARLHSDYNEINCLYQDVTSERVYEAYQCYDSKPECFPFVLMAVLHKATGRYSLYKLVEK